MDELLTWQEAVARAGTPGQTAGWLRANGWWRVFRDVYAPASCPDSPQTRCAALRRVLPPDVALSHRTALWVLGLDVLGRCLDVTVPRGRHLERRPGVRVHTAALPDRELCDVRGLLVVSAARAVVDVARSEPFLDAVAVGDAALRSGATRMPALEASMAEARGLRGCVAARAVLPHLDPRSESAMESRLRMVLRAAGLIDVESQVDVYDEIGHMGRVDLLVSGLVAVEFDGRASHLDDQAFVQERRRQNRLLAAGCEVRRYTAPDVYRRPGWAIADEVARAVDLTRARGPVRVRRGPDTLPAPRLRPLPTRADPAR